MSELRQELFNTLSQLSPLARPPVLTLLEPLARQQGRISRAQFRRLKADLLAESQAALEALLATQKSQEIYPTLSCQHADQSYLSRLNADLNAAFDRVALRSSLTREEKLEILRGMLTTRYVDARLKKFFLSSEIKTPNGAIFQGKGFRSMGQEAIYAAGIRLRRIGPPYAASRDGKAGSGAYTGDYVAPVIRDVGLALAMGLRPYDVMAAQMGKVGKPTNGKDLHIGDLSCGVVPPAAPIALSTGNAVGLGLALQGSGRVVINCNGEGGVSAGEWHEAINFAGVRKMPIVFILQNNQTALSTPTKEQFACRELASKAIGYGLRAITIDGTDPEAVFAAVTEAANACRRGEGPVVVELICMRMCGHAHHDDMLYFGHEPDQFVSYPEIKNNGYIDAELFAYWRNKDPISTYSMKLISQTVVTAKQVEQLVAEVENEIEATAKQVVAAPWPSPASAGGPVFTDGDSRVHHEPLQQRQAPFPAIEEWRPTEPLGFTPDPNGKTFWQAIAEALHEEMAANPHTFILGQDVGGKYGNAFVILRVLLDQFGDRIINTPLSEAAIIGAATGAALLGKRPVAEIQFNDFVASGFNQLVNNTAKIFARLRHPVPVTIRLPWGGLRCAGPYHSQNTEPWFYRTPGLKIVCPATPREAKALLKAAIRDDNPVLYYEHIALYRSADIKEPLEDETFILPLGTAHLKRDGSDLTIITYGAYVHRGLAAAERLHQEHGISCKVLDLRSLQPLDKAAILWCVKQTNRVLILHEDSKTGGIGQSVASIIAEEAFEYLDAPVRVLGALDSPVPYSPPLEETFIISQEQIVTAARLLAEY
ncbi:MAG: thiamine pyrophosphate-dependent enzyme [bacterium]